MTQNNRRIIYSLAQKTCGWGLFLAAAQFAHADVAAPPTAQPITPSAPPVVDSSSEHAGYLFGLTFGEQMHSVGISNQVSPDDIAKGIKDGLQGRKSTRADQQQIQSFVQSIMAETLTHNKAAAREFLTQNGHDKNVKTTASGLQYKVLIPGNLKASSPRPDEDVTVNYRGKLLDGSEFDSSYARGTPATFKVNGVIKGWQEALVLMKPGSKWQLFIAPELAYDTSARPGIPAGSLLIFDVELISVKANAVGQPTPQSHIVVPPLKPTPVQ